MTYRSHIAVNTRVLQSKKLDGIGRFTFELLQRMVYAHPDIRFSFFFDRPYEDRFVFAENIFPHIIPPPTRHPIIWKWWFHYLLPLKIRQLSPNLFFSPEFYLTNHATIPQIPVFHDIAYEHFPQDIGKWAAYYCRKYSRIYAHKASHVITVSEFSKSDIITHYQLAPESVSVVYNGVSDHFHPISEPEKATIREQYAQGQPYFHFVGTLQPRKNIPNLLKSFDLFKQQVPSKVKLVLVGREGWKNNVLKETYEQMAHKEDVLFTGYVTDKVLNDLHAASLGLCFIPYFEGFGIPILEAMHCEVPVICSNGSSIPEVAGDAAIMVDPFQVNEIADAMKQLYIDSHLREKLINKGKRQREKFSWDLTYQKTWEVLSQYL